MTQIQTPDLGGFLLQYTNSAKSIVTGLKQDVRDRLRGHLVGLSENNPYAGGTTPDWNNDRRVTSFEGMKITFWLASEVKVMTVVDVLLEEEE